jgi:hypothetical protein
VVALFFLHWTAMVFLLVTKQYSLFLLFPLTPLHVSLEPSPDSEVPCGLALNSVYYVIASGLTANSFYVAATSGGTAISATGAASGTFYVAQPVSLSGYVIDSDVKQGLTGDQVATFRLPLLMVLMVNFNL